MKTRSPILDPIFYVYLHLTGTDGRVFYVGKGCGSRVSSSSGRSDAWRSIVRDNGYVKRIVTSGLLELDSLELEALLIDELRRSGEPLVNKTSGGQGLSGVTASKETRALQSIAKLGKSNRQNMQQKAQSLVRDTRTRQKQ